MKKASLVLLALLAGPAAAEEAAIRLAPEQAKAAAINLVPLESLASSGARRLPAQAVVPPARIEILAAPLGGMVVAVGAAYGETVRRGQMLARLQGPQVLELQREYVSAGAQADVAAENRRRDESLFADGIISQARLSATQAAERQAAAAIAEKRAALRLSGAAEPGRDGRGLSGATEVRAPFDGVVLDAQAQPGARVEASALLFKLGRMAPLWLEIQASPAQAAGLASGDAVTVPGCKGEGRLTLVAPQMNPATQALLLRAELPNADGCLRPFQFINAQITPAAAPAGGAWRVPNGALVRHLGQTWLFAEAADGYRPVPVRVLDETERSTLVAAADGAPALAAATRIVVKGTAAVKAVWLGIGASEGK